MAESIACTGLWMAPFGREYMMGGNAD